jgi:hypothetical protein
MNEVAAQAAESLVAYHLLKLHQRPQPELPGNGLGLVLEDPSRAHCLDKVPGPLLAAQGPDAQV